MALVLVFTWGWVSDDGFISFRIAENFASGYGPVWNVGERVQAFTSPLWQLVLSLGPLLHVDLYAWAIGLGLALTLAAFVLLRELLDRDLGAPLGFWIAATLLLGSDVFLQFQTSGLECALTNALLLLLLRAVYGPTPQPLLWAALVLLTRPDTVPLLVPITAAAIACKRPPASHFVIAALPIVAWLAFAKLYFGFFAPNTAYLKIGIWPLVVAVQHGFDYVYDYTSHELLQSLTIAAAVLFSVVVVVRRRNLAEVTTPAVVLSAAIVAQLAYVIFVGGDFMRGRFLDVVLILGAVLVGIVGNRLLNRAPGSAPLVLGVFFAAFAAEFVANTIMEQPVIGLSPRGVVNERYGYMADNWVWTYRKDTWRPAAMLRQYAQRFGPIAYEASQIGRLGYEAGPLVDIIDNIGLPDAFVARLPIDYDARPGHPYKSLPESYQRERHIINLLPDWEFRLYGMDPTLRRDALAAGPDWRSSDLERFAHEVTLITTGPIFSPERIRAIEAIDPVPKRWPGPSGASAQFSGGSGASDPGNLIRIIPNPSVPFTRYHLFDAPRDSITVSLNPARALLDATLLAQRGACYTIEFYDARGAKIATGSLPAGIPGAAWRSVPDESATPVGKFVVTSRCTDRRPAIASIVWRER